MTDLVSAALGVLNSFRTEVSTWTNQGLVTSIESHIAQIETAAAQDVRAGETAVHSVLTELYGAFHGHAAEPEPTPVAPIEAPAPVVAAPIATPVAVDPTPAPSTTTEASSAPSNTPSTSATDVPATPAV